MVNDHQRMSAEHARDVITTHYRKALGALGETEDGWDDVFLKIADLISDWQEGFSSRDWDLSLVGYPTVFPSPAETTTGDDDGS
jgi:hypothetical protein